METSNFKVFLQFKDICKRTITFSGQFRGPYQIKIKNNTNKIVLFTYSSKKKAMHDLRKYLALKSNY